MMRPVSVFLLFFILCFVSRMQAQQLPSGSNTWFSGSGICVLCHNTSDYALRDSQGSDVSPVVRWRSTMLANSSKDPFWKAKVKHEGIENHAHKEALENVCTRCHAPMGMINAFLNASGNYTLQKLQDDALGKDGISCTLCHQVDDFSDPDFSGHFGINASKEIYGPYENPIAVQMEMNTGYTPVYSEKINESRLCGSCHTLLTHSVDEHGEFTGEVFVEQAIYHEWENSIFGEENTSCQSCHLPRIDETVKISSRPGFIAGRQPFGIHNFTGGNVFMLNLLKENHEALELDAGTELLEETILRTRDLLTEETVDLNIPSMDYINDSVFIEVRLKNKAGHKFPTGFPSRRAFLQCIVTSGSDTLFHSGEPGAGALTNTSTDHFEPHYKVINQDEQVQIYEFVMGNTGGEVTTVLERAYVPLKDNRIVPEGFQQEHSNYDTVKVVGKAVYDPDYFSGTGGESLIYAIPLSGVGTSAKVKISLHYQTVPESWVADLFEEADKDADIQRFKAMYLASGRSPVLIAADSVQISSTPARELEQKSFRLYPNPTSGKIRVEGLEKDVPYSIFSLEGRWVQEGFIEGVHPEIDLDLPPGSYYFVIHSSGRMKARRIILK